MPGALGRSYLGQPRGPWTAATHQQQGMLDQLHLPQQAPQPHAQLPACTAGGAPMHCMLLRAATLMLVDRHRTTAWQSAPRREVSTPTSALSKNATSRCTMARNSSALARTGPRHSGPVVAERWSESGCDRPRLARRCVRVREGCALPRQRKGHSVPGLASAKCCR